MIGTKWYYVDGSATIKTATVIAETPRKWTLRDDDAGEWARSQEPMGAPGSDHQIHKSGGDVREGRNWRGKLSRTFFATEAAAQIHLAKIQAEGWRSRHVYRISKAVGQIKDPTLLAKVADLIGYPKDGT